MFIELLKIKFMRNMIFKYPKVYYYTIKYITCAYVIVKL